MLVCFPSWGFQLPQRSVSIAQKSCPSASPGPSTRRPCRKGAPSPEPPSRTASGDEHMQTHSLLNLPGLLWSPRWSWVGGRERMEGCGRGQTLGNPQTWCEQRSGWGQMTRGLWSPPVLSAQEMDPPGDTEQGVCRDVIKSVTNHLALILDLWIYLDIQKSQTWFRGFLPHMEHTTPSVLRALNKMKKMSTEKPFTVMRKTQHTPWLNSL